MSEQWNCKDLPSDHLWGIVVHAQKEIDMWISRRQQALGHLAARDEIVLEDYYTEPN